MFANSTNESLTDNIIRELVSSIEDEKEIEEFTKGFPFYKPLKLSCQWLHVEKLGRISEVQKNSFKIRFFEQELPAKLKGSFYEEESENWPVVGDYVTFLYKDNQNHFHQNTASSLRRH